MFLNKLKIFICFTLFISFNVFAQITVNFISTKTPYAEIYVNNENIGNLDANGVLSIPVKASWSEKQIPIAIKPQKGLPITGFNKYISSKFDNIIEIKLTNLLIILNNSCKFLSLDKNFHEKIEVSKSKCHLFVKQGNVELFLKLNNGLITSKKINIPQGITDLSIDMRDSILQVLQNQQMNDFDNDFNSSLTSSNSDGFDDWENNRNSNLSNNSSKINNQFNNSNDFSNNNSGSNGNIQTNRYSNDIFILIISIFIVVLVIVIIIIGSIKKRKKTKNKKQKSSKRKTIKTTGEFIGKFAKIEKISSGAYGDLWKCINPENNTVVAIKIAREDKDINETTAMFVNEHKVLENLFHQNIVRVFSKGISYGKSYIVMEYIDGVTLRDAISNKFPALNNLKTILKIIIDTARALNYLHQLPTKIIHKDLKPENIMLTTDSQNKIIKRVVVIDYGISGEENKQIKFTPAYMSPEHFPGKILDESSDIFSLGTIFYELITWTPLFYGNDSQIMNQVINFNPSTISFDDKYEDISLILKQMLEVDIEKRFKNTTILLQQLTKLCFERGILID